MKFRELVVTITVTTLLSTGFTGVSGTPQTLSLEKLFEISEKRNSQLRTSIASEEVARLETEVAKSARLPEIKASLSLSYIGDGFTTARKFSDVHRAAIPHFGNGAGIKIEQPLFTGGAITRSIEMTELKSTAARYSTELQRDNIRFQLAGAYLDLYKCRNLRKVIMANLENARTLLQEMKARFEQGVALQNDITRYELLESNLELQMIKIDNTSKILNDQLVTLSGLERGTIVEPDSTILERSLPLTDEQWWQSEATSHSPRLRLADNAINMTKKGESIVKTDRFPKIGLQAAWSIDGPILTEVPPINRNLSYWYLGLGISYDLSSLYKTNRKLAHSRAATFQAKEAYAATKEDLEHEIRSDYIRYLETYEELKTMEKSVELASRNYHVVSTRYLADMALISDMLDASNSLLEAEQQLENARINIIYYYYKLLFTSGKI